MRRSRRLMMAGFLLAALLGSGATAFGQVSDACVQWTPVIREEGGALREPAVAGIGLDISRGGGEARPMPPASIRVEFCFTRGTTGPAISALLQVLLQDAVRKEFGGPVGIEVWESKDGTSFFAKGERIVSARSKSDAPAVSWEIAAVRNGLPLPCTQEAPARPEDEAGPGSPLRLEIRKRLVAAKPPGLKWTDLNEKALDVMVDLVWMEVRAKAEAAGMGKDDVRRIAREVRREGMTDEQSLPSDDPKKRWEELTGTKFANLRRIDLKDEWGNLDSPMVDVFADEGKTIPAGQMNHDEWVMILESKGPMTKVQRRRDKKEAWIETKWLKEIYTKEDIEKGPKKDK
jgi:hypothetical protein